MNTTQKLNQLITELSNGLFEREESLKLTLLSMIAGKSIFLYGPPGTAKSLIAKRASLAFGGESKFFSYLLNRFSTPEEIFGPVDLSELKKGNLKRKTEGYLPKANFAFLDEIWKSSPAILNTLLTIINERIYRDGGENHKVPLQGIVCASNEFPPANQGLEALYDRMLLRVCVFPMQEKESFEKLLALSETQEITPSTTFSPKELEEIQKQAKTIPFSSEALEVLHYIKATLSNPPKLTEEEESRGIYVSDRRWQNIAQLLRVATFLSERSQVEKLDLMLLRHCLWESEEQREVIDEILKQAMKDVSLYDAQAIKKADMQWDEFEKKMSSLLYKSNGQPNLKIEQETLQNCSKQCQKLLEVFDKTQAPAIAKKQALKESFINPFLSNEDFDIALVDLTRFIQDIELLKLKVEDMQSQIQAIQDLIKTENKSSLSKPKKTKTTKPHQPDSKAKLQSLIESGTPLGDIDISLITDMSRLFADSPRKDFSGIEEWDTSNVENMSRMFENCKTFNHPISSWDTSSVEDMSYMFLNCEKFNQSLDSWDVSSVTTMSHMFENCESFNSSLNEWKPKNCKDMSFMFLNCSSFNQSLNGWDTSSVENMEGLFANCEKFNKQINKWNVRSVKKMNGMFDGCKIYNQPLGEWDVSNVVNMASLFQGCNFFNQPLEEWDVSNVEDMSFMFYKCYRFNRYICDWNVSNVKSMRYMFAGGSYGDSMIFNQPIGRWDVSNVEDMESMFGTGWRNWGNYFNQDLSSWQIDKAKCKTTDMFKYCQIDSSNKPQGL